MTNYDHILEQYPENVPVAVAAKLLGKPVAWVQHGLRSRALPFSSCVEFERASFHIAAGTGDPSNQRATSGWKATKVAKRLVEAFMVRLEAAGTFESGAN